MLSFPLSNSWLPSGHKGTYYRTPSRLFHVCNHIWDIVTSSKATLAPKHSSHLGFLCFHFSVTLERITRNLPILQSELPRIEWNRWGAVSLYNISLPHQSHFSLFFLYRTLQVSRWTLDQNALQMRIPFHLEPLYIYPTLQICPMFTVLWSIFNSPNVRCHFWFS